MKTFATLIDNVQSALGGDTTLFTDAIVIVQLEDAIREISDYEPYVAMHSFKLESRTGTATTDTTNALVDSAAQFLEVPTDVGKVIYNPDDRTWARVTAFVNTSHLTLSKDIMEDGNEAYKIFNKGCHTIKQINLEDITDYIGPDHGVIAVEYKTLKEPRVLRNWRVDGDILTIDIDFAPPDSADSDADVEVFVWFNKRHLVSQLTDLDGTVYLTALSAGDTSMVVDALTDGEVVEEDQRFTVASGRTIYSVTTALTLSTEVWTEGGGVLLFYPGLESDVAADATVTLIGSTLNRRLERLVVDLCAARTALSIHANAISKGGQGVYNRYERKLGLALAELESGMTLKTKRVYPKVAI